MESTSLAAQSAGAAEAIVNRTPSDAGTIVMGIVPTTPPTVPPKRSITTVATTAAPAAMAPLSAATTH
jgi:hypothetical protein